MEKDAASKPSQTCTDPPPPWTASHVPYSTPVPPLIPSRSFLRAQAFRLIRFINYIPWKPCRQSLIRSWFSCWKLYFWLEVMHWIFLWCMAILGANIFDDIKFPEEHRLEYDTLIECLVTTYIISSGSTWHTYMLVDVVDTGADWFRVGYTAVYLMILVLMGLFMVTALFVAVQIRQISHDMKQVITVNLIYSEYSIQDPRTPCIAQLVEQSSELTLIGEPVDPDAEEHGDSEGDSKSGGGGGRAGAGDGPNFAPPVDPIGVPRERAAGGDLMPHSGASRRVANFVVSTAFQWLVDLNIVAHCVFVALVNDKASEVTEVIYTLGLALCLVFFAVEIVLKVPARTRGLLRGDQRGPREQAPLDLGHGPPPPSTHSPGGLYVTCPPQDPQIAPLATPNPPSPTPTAHRRSQTNALPPPPSKGPPAHSQLGGAIGLPILTEGSPPPPPP